MKKILLPLILFTGFMALFGETYPVNIQIIPGKNYAHRQWFGIFPVTLTPQIALWMEDGTGRFLGTLYLTQRSASNSWRGTEGGRPEALPLYFHARSAGENVDGVSGASMKSGTLERQTEADLPEGAILIRAEINSSFDYNAFYTKVNSGVNGQPSLLYEGIWNGGEERVTLKPVGTGSGDGTSGEAAYSLEGITTALSIVESITLSR